MMRCTPAAGRQSAAARTIRPFVSVASFLRVKPLLRWLRASSDMSNSWTGWLSFDKRVEYSPATAGGSIDAHPRAGRPPRVARVSEDARIHTRGRAVAGHRRRREHGDLQRRERAAHQAP